MSIGTIGTIQNWNNLPKHTKKKEYKERKKDK